MPPSRRWRMFCSLANPCFPAAPCVASFNTPKSWDVVDVFFDEAEQGIGALSLEPEGSWRAVTESR